MVDNNTSVHAWSTYMNLGHFDVGGGEAEVLGDLVGEAAGDDPALCLRPLRAGEVVDVLALPRILRMCKVYIYNTVRTDVDDDILIHLHTHVSNYFFLPQIVPGVDGESLFDN
jgi:hypothetical protein